jgi:hypothetical protein
VQHCNGKENVGPPVGPTTSVTIFPNKFKLLGDLMAEEEPLEAGPGAEAGPS